MADIRALLLTDVVDSTKLSEKIGDAAMAEVWLAHDRAARDLLPAWHGREIDKTDGMLLMFDTAADAVNYAMAYHRALAAMPTPLKARAGLHVGPVILRENSAEDVARGAKPLEVDGLAKPTAARVMSLARGGQILLTPEARAALGETTLKLESHGHWVMKGVSEPIELFEIGDEETRFAAPPDSDKVYRVVRVGERWVPVAKVPNNLPQQATSFIGREKELDDVKALLSEARLITLLGMGGLGKTRLSLQVAAEVMPQYPDGAWFIDLTPIRDAARVADEAARVLDVAEEPGRPLLQTLCAHLKAKRLLLILDNCEQVVDAAAQLVAAVLSAAPQVRIIASSRESLRAPGEHAYPILPLPLPDRGAGLETLAQSTAVRLFVERAKANKPAFELTEKDAPAVADLVERLEGIPLALELAAARVRVLSVAEIDARVQDRFKLLTGGGRTLPQRQQTLRALVDWSYDLLCDNEKCLLDRLAVFVGGFDLAGSGGRVRRGSDRCDRCARPARLAGREVAGDARRAERQQPLPHAGDDPRVRAGEAGRRRRRIGHGGAALRALLRFRKGRPRRAHWRRTGTMGTALRDGAREPARCNFARFDRRGRPIHRGEDCGCPYPVLDFARLRDRGARRRACGAGASGGAVLRPCACLDALRWRWTRRQSR